MAGIATDGTTPQKRPLRDYQAFFEDADRDDKDLHIGLFGPQDGTHFAGEWTLEEAIEFATDILVEVDRRKQLVT